MSEKLIKAYKEAKENDKKWAKWIVGGSKPRSKKEELMRELVNEDNKINQEATVE